MTKVACKRRVRLVYINCSVLIDFGMHNGALNVALVTFGDIKFHLPKKRAEHKIRESASRMDDDGFMELSSKNILKTFISTRREF